MTSLYPYVCGMTAEDTELCIRRDGSYFGVKAGVPPPCATPIIEGTAALMTIMLPIPCNCTALLLKSR